MVRFALPAVVLALSACAATPAQIAQERTDTARDEAKLEKRLAGFTPGPTVSCIRPTNGGVDIFGDTLVYHDTGSRLYKTRTTGGCFGLKRDDIIVTRSFSGQVCRGDIIHTVDRANGFPSGACSFGDFTVYTRHRAS